MTEQTRSERVAAAREEFKDSIAADEENGGSKSRWNYLKSKKSQSIKATANVVRVKDELTDRIYTVSVNVNVTGKDSDLEILNEKHLSSLQSVINDFLQNIHENI